MWILILDYVYKNRGARVHTYSCHTTIRLELLITR